MSKNGIAYAYEINKSRIFGNYFGFMKINKNKFMIGFFF